MLSTPTLTTDPGPDQESEPNRIPVACLVEVLSPRLLSFHPPRKLLPLSGFVHWLLDYFTSAAATAVPTYEAASLERPWAMVADTGTDTVTHRITRTHADTANTQ